ncbi:MAG TPA: PaaI family thioesterase [Myxococcota bacterium]|nr:PaaI family thioesterase [Myxococcota bacterium]
MADAAQLNEVMKGLLPGTLGIELVEVGPERVRARLRVEERLCTIPGMLHGGVVMAFADTLGAVATAQNLRNGDGTTTIESKTNFLAAGRSGTTIEGDCTPLHRGRRTMVWQTRVSGPDGKLLALVTQTQAVLERTRAPDEVLSALFAGKSLPEQQALLASLERAGGALYQSFAEHATDAQVKDELLAAAEREEANAVALERLLARKER